MDLQENLKVGNSLRTLKNIQMESHASKQGEAGVFCELLRWAEELQRMKVGISYISTTNKPKLPLCLVENQSRIS